MLAVNSITKDLDTEVQKILPSMKIVKENAEYFSMVDNNVILFYPSERKEKNTFTYIINGKFYETLGTGVITYFEEYGEVEIQQSLF